MINNAVKSLKKNTLQFGTDILLVVYVMCISVWNFQETYSMCFDNKCLRTAYVGYIQV